MGFETIGACRQTDTVIMLLLFALVGDRERERESDLKDFRDVDTSKAPPPYLSATISVHRRTSHNLVVAREKRPASVYEHQRGIPTCASSSLSLFNVRNTKIKIGHKI